jgi:hypothetical protein
MKNIHLVNHVNSETFTEVECQCLKPGVKPKIPISKKVLYTSAFNPFHPAKSARGFAEGL